MKNRINIRIVLEDIGAIFTLVFVPLCILLQVVKGINYFESLSIEWWMVIALLILMLKSDFLGLSTLDRLMKYFKPIITKIKDIRKSGATNS